MAQVCTDLVSLEYDMVDVALVERPAHRQPSCTRSDDYAVRTHFIAPGSADGDVGEPERICICRVTNLHDDAVNISNIREDRSPTLADRHGALTGRSTATSVRFGGFHAEPPDRAPTPPGDRGGKGAAASERCSVRSLTPRAPAPESVGRRRQRSSE